MRHYTDIKKTGGAQMAFGKNLKELRESENLTQGELAEKIGVSQVAISQFERGETNPKLTTLKLLAGFFRTSVERLTQ